MSGRQTPGQGSSFERWLDVYDRAYAAPELLSTLACPNCGAHELALRFVLYGSRTDEGHAAFWCNNCQHGIALGPSTIPPAGVRVPREQADIPRYRIVPPAAGGSTSDPPQAAV